MSVLLLVLAVGLGVVAAAARASRARVAAELASERERSCRLEGDLKEAQDRAEELNKQASELRVKLGRLEEKIEADKQLFQEREGALRRQFEEQKRMLEEAEKNLVSVFEATGAKLLQSNADRFMQQAEKSFEEKAKPIRELLDAQKKAVDDLERKRETAYVRLDEQIKQIATAHERLGAETGRLVSALRRPEQRGRWGELQLRNVVELAGMTEHCDFQEQPQTDDPSTRDRPDMVVRMPGGGVIVVDSKVSLDAYLNAIQPDADREAQLQRHASQVRTHVRNLASKAYWDQFDHTPKLVVLFMPLESALVAALEVIPDLHSEAMKQHVLIATPTLLVATLRAVAYGWQQEAIAENAHEIADVGRDLYDRLATFANHFSNVGDRLKRASECYNNAVGSLERNLLPGARHLRQLRATTADEIESPPQIDTDIRKITAPELQQDDPDEQ